MSVFITCESCDKIAEVICECSSPPHYFCESDASDHRRSGGIHPFRDALIPLSPEELSFLRQASDEFQKKAIGVAIHRKNKTIEGLLKQIRKAEEDCSKEIESIFEERLRIEKICAFKVLPLDSDDSLFSSLLSLKASSNFYFQEILQQFLSLRSSLIQYSSSSPVLSSSIPPLSSPQWELLHQFQAHDEAIYSVAVSDCEKYLASGSGDKTIKIWDLESLECIHTLSGHTDWVRSVAFWGNKVISGSLDNTIKIWEDSECLDTLSLHSHRVNSLCVSSCNRLLVSGGGDNKIVVFNLEENKTVHTILSHSCEVNSVLFSPSNKEIVSGSWDKSIKVWKTDTAELLITLNGHSSTITSLCFWNKYLVSSSADNNVKVWDIDKREVIKSLKGHYSYVVRVQASEYILGSLGQDNSIRVWERVNGQNIETLEGHGDYSEDSYWYPMGLQIFKGGDYIISGGRDKNIKIFNKLS